MMKNLRVFYAIGISFLFYSISLAQTTVINPLAEGGFELGTTFVDNGWTVVNGTATSTQNQWILGLSSTTGVGTGNCAYITNNTGTGAYAYTNNSAMYVVHFYRDVVIPANETKALLSFKWKCVGETGVFDGIQVSIAPTSVTPTATATAPSGAVTGPIVPNAFVAGNFLYFGQSTTNTSTVLLPVGAIGPCNTANTVRLIFTFRLDGSLGTSPGAAIDDISLITSSTNISSMGGTYTIDNTLPTSGTNFANFTDAITELNAVSLCGINGPIQFNVTAGQIFNENVPFITATGSATNSITFVKSGMGVNPVIKPTGGTGSTDFGVGLNGSDYIVFDGIDVDASAVSAVEYGYYVINTSATNGAQNNIIRNAAITLNRTNTSSRAIYQNVAITPSSAAGANSFNKYYNLTISNAYVGCYLLGNSAFPDLSCEVGSTSPTQFNQIGNPGTPNDIGNGSSVTWGIRGTSQNGIKVYNNQISNLTVTGGVTCSGIFIENGQGNIEIYRNKIQDLKSTSTSTSAILYGIRSDVNSGATSIVSNNFISGFTHAITTASSTVIIRALASNIGSNAGTNKFFHNTVLVNLATTAASSAAAHLTAGTAELRNNILINLSPGAATSKRYVINKVGGTLVSNYNDLFVATSTNNFIGFNVADQATFANWKASSGTPDLNSFNLNPTFVSATDLHLNYGITPNEFESGGAEVSVTNITFDYDNQTRPGPAGSVNGGASKPDIGADEFDGVILDNAGPSISYTNLGITCETNDRVMANVEIVDLSGVPTSGILVPRIYYAKKPVGGPLGSWFSQPGSLSSGSGQNGSWSFTIVASDMGGLSVTDSVFYYVIAQDIVTPTPNISSNPTGAAATDVNTVTTPPSNPKKYIIANNLSGTFTVGSGGIYPTLTAAVASYNNSCLSGPVVFNLIDATYSASETFPITINNNSYASSTNTLTIKPNTTSVITGSVGAGSLLKLNGADYIIIDGSNSGGTDRSLTIQNTTTTTSGNAAVWLASPSLGNGANNNTIKNCIIEGNSASTTFIGVNIGGSTTIEISASPGNELNNNNTIHNNLFRKTQYGVAMFGSAANAPDQNNSITNNTFGTMVSGEGHFWMGITADRQDNLIISGNEIQNIVNNTASTSSNICGMRLLDFKNGKAFNNNIHDISYTSTSTPKVYGIYVQSSTYTTVGNPSNALVYNNTISKLNSTGTSGTWNMTGILASSGYGDRFYYNSVHLTGQLCNSASGLVAAFGHGDGNVSTFCNNVDVRNNIFNLEGSSATAGGNFWVLYSRATSLSGSVSNYNLLRCAGTNATNNTGRVNSVNFVTLTDWQTATTLDLNSITTAPVFASSTNLHLPIASNVAINNLGTPLATVTTDIDGDTRDASNPDIGADEFVVVSCSGTPVAGSISPINATRCTNQTYTMSATGMSAGLGITYQWKTGPSGGPYMNVTGGTGATSTSYTTDLLSPGTYFYVLETTCTNSGLNATTNEFTLTVNPNPSAIISPTGPTFICAPATQLFTASTNFGDAYRWKKNGSNISGATSNTYTANTSGNYQIVVTLSSTGCKDSSAVSILSVNDAPATTISATPNSICTGENSQLNVTGSSLINKYAFAAGTGSTLDPMVGATPVIGTSNDDTPMAAPSNIGFTFNYNGTNYTKFSASPDGWILFGNSAASSEFTNVTTSTTNVPKLYPYWDDLATGADGGVETLLTGVAPNRIFIVQWRVTIPRNLTGAYNSTFQAWMYEGSNKIEFRYGTMGTPSSGTISGGLSAGGTNFQSLTFNSNSVSTTTANDVNTIAPPSGTIYTFDPGPFNYNWSPAGNLNASNIANPLASALTSTTKFFVTVTNANTTCSKIDSVTVNVSSGPSISTQPAAVSGCLGGNANFTVVATGAGLTYQWKKDGTDLMNGGNIAGATTNMLTVSGLTGGDAGIYTVVVTSTCGSPITSDGTSVLTVNPNPTASISPTGLTVICEGQSQVYTATTDIGNSYVWKRNGLIIPGEILSTYTATLNGTYQVVISNSVSTCKDSSTVVGLSLTPNPTAVSISATSTSLCAGNVSTLNSTGGILNYLNTNSRLAINKLIPDNATDTLRDTIIVAGMPPSGALDSVIVTLNITHPFVSDLDIFLRAPNGNTMELSTDNGSTGDNYTNTRLTTVSTATDITLASAPFTGTFRAEGYLNLSNLGSVLNGNWQLLVYDDFASDEGTLLNWSLKLVRTDQATTTWSPTAGLYTDAGATIAYTGGPTTTVYASPGTTTSYTATATSTFGCTSSNSVSIGVTGDEVMNENNDGTGSLRKAIECTAAGDTVFVSSGSVNLINLLTQLNIDKPLLILDDNGSPVMLKFDFSSGALMSETNGGFKVGTMGNVTLDNIHVKHVANDATHPVIKNEGILTLKNSKVTGETGNTVPPVVQNATGATINAEGSSEIKNE